MNANLYEVAYKSLRADRKLALEFSVVMARFEYAIKRSGYRRGSPCLAAWQRLGNELNSSSTAYQPQNVREAIDYLVGNPPMFLNGEMEWTESALSGATDLGRALDAVVRVRNNLFHGRKGDNERRNNLLFSHSICFISAILSDRHDIKEAYCNPDP